MGILLCSGLLAVAYASEPTCDPIPSPSYATSGCSSWGTIADGTGKCIFIGNPGYSTTDSTTLTCSHKAEWSGAAPVFKANTCEALTAPTNGKVEPADTCTKEVEATGSVVCS